MAARLKRHVQRCIAEVAVACGTDCLDLGMRATQLPVKALPHHLASARDHRSHQWVGAHPPAALFGQLDRACEVAAIGVGLDAHS